MKLVRKTKILFLSANPEDKDRLEVEKESNKIEDTIRATKYRDNFDLKSRHAVSREEILKIIGNYNPDIVHFAGHGKDDRTLLFEGINGESEATKASDLGEMFRGLNARTEAASDGIKIRLVVLNACFSNDTAESIKQSVDCVIGMRRAIKDLDEAQEFAVEFYRSICQGDSIGNSFNLAKIQLGIVNEGSDIPQIVHRDEIRPDTITFVPELQSSGSDGQQDLRPIEQGISHSGPLLISDRTTGSVLQPPKIRDIEVTADIIKILFTTTERFVDFRNVVDRIGQELDAGQQKVASAMGNELKMKFDFLKRECSDCFEYVLKNFPKEMWKSSWESYHGVHKKLERELNQVHEKISLGKIVINFEHIQNQIKDMETDVEQIRTQIVREIHTQMLE